MSTVKAISAAMKLIDVKKENLRKAFEDLQEQSSSLSSFTLTWSDLDYHFSSIQSSLQHKFTLLQSLELPESQTSKPSPKKSQFSSSSAVAVKNSSETVRVTARPELKSFCEKMDGLGLRKYIIELLKERSSIKAEILDAFRYSPDAATMVLDAMEGFYSMTSKGGKNVEEEISLRRICVIFLETLIGLKPEIRTEVKERAMRLAVEWKGKMSADGGLALEALGFLNLVAAFGLVSGFDIDELIDLIVVVPKYKQQFIELCRALNLGERIADVIQKLISKGKQLLAIKFIFEFNMTDKFPPVPLLKAYAMESKNLAKKTRKSGNHSRQSLNQATTKEASVLKSVIKCIDDYNLESEYPKKILLNRIEKLEKDLASRKRSAAATVAKTREQPDPQKRSIDKRPRATVVASPASTPKSIVANSTVPLLQQPQVQEPHLHTAGLLPDHPHTYLSLPAGPYGSAGSNPALPPYAGSSAGLYESSRAPLGGYSGNPTPNGSSSYPSESYMPSGYYEMPVAYGGYPLPPQYHPSYYP